MDFKFSQKSLDLQEKMNKFFEEHIFPNEEAYEKAILDSGDPLHIPELLDELKEKARKEKVRKEKENGKVRSRKENGKGKKGKGGKMKRKEKGNEMKLKTEKESGEGMYQKKTKRGRI